jgi:glutaredoxin 3
MGARAVVISLAVSATLLAAGVVRYRLAMARNVAPAVAVAAPIEAPGQAPRAGSSPRRPDAPKEVWGREENDLAAATPAPEQTTETAAPASPEPQGPPAPAPAPLSLADVHVIVYTTSWCSVCKRAKAWMTDRGIAYEERDIETSSENSREMRALNPRGSIPTFDVDGAVMVGFSEGYFMSTMRRAAQRRAEQQGI